MVLPDSDGVSRVPPYSGFAQGVRKVLATGLLPAMAGLSRPVRLPCCTHIGVLQPQGASSLVWANPLSLAATDGITFVFFS